MKKSWRTTILGVISSLASLVVAVPEIVENNPKIVKSAAFIMAGGIAGMGIAGKDQKEK